MNIVNYYVNHVFPSGLQSFSRAFRAWGDLITDNWADYAVSKDDDPFMECQGWFWVLLGEDNVLPKFFLEELQEMIERIDRGEEELIEMNFEELIEIDKLLSETEDGFI